jgi:transcriptional regulator with XRE-family HTH domain
MTTLGAELKYVRKRRGLSQQELAEKAKVSVTVIRHLEQGRKDKARMETVHRLARVLRVPTSRLLDGHKSDEATNATVDLWRPVREALEGPFVQPDEEPTIEGMEAALAEVRRVYFAGQLAKLSIMLPPMLRDADALAQDNGDGREIRNRLLQMTGSVLTQTRQYESAELALDRALGDASDGLRGASIVTTLWWLRTRQARLADAREVSVKWADDVEPRRISRANVEELAAWGWLLLGVAAASVRDNRYGEAQEAMRLARGAAVLTQREVPAKAGRLSTWGPTTWAHKHAETALLMGDPSVALRMWENGPKGRVTPTADNYNRHRLTVADAMTHVGKHAEAVEILSELDEGAPEWLPHQRYAGDVLQKVIDGRRTVTPEMRRLADKVGLPV